MSNRFHNKFHRHNHHTEPTDRDGQFPDSAYDPIASPDSPFRGEFYIDGNITTLSSVSALGDLFASNGTFHEDVTIEGNLSVLGTTTQLDTFVYVTSALDITNVGTGPALKVTQSGNQPIAHFIDSNGDDIIFADDGHVGLGTTSPNEKLTVIGNISATGNTITDGNSYLSGSSFIVNNLTVDTNTLFVNSANNKVGIGTSNPNEKLTVSGNISAVGNHVFEANSTYDALIITQTGTGNALVVEDTTNPDSTPFVINQYGQMISGSLSAWSPTAGLQLNSDSTFAPNANIELRRNSNTVNAAGLVFLKARGTQDSPLVVQTGDFLGSIGFLGHDSVDFRNTVSISARVDGTPVPSLSSIPSLLSFLTTLSGDNVITEKMRITHDGKVGIGTASPGAKLTVSGTLSSSSTVEFPNIGTGADDSVVILDASGFLRTDEVDSRVWGSSLVDGTGTANKMTKWSDSNTVTNSIVTDNGTLVSISGNLSSSGTVTIGTIATGTADSVLIESAGLVQKRTIDSRAWGSSLVDGTGTANRVAYWTDSNTISADNDFFFNGTNVGIGTSNPNKKLTVIGDISATGNISTDSQFLSAGVDLFDIFSSISTGGLASGAYLPLSGGTVTGSVTVTGTVFAESFVLTTPGLIVFDTVSAAAIPVTTLPIIGNDVELYSTTAVTITAFQNGIKGTLYTLTNKGTGTVTITASPTNFVRNGQLWSNRYIELSTNYACSLRADINNVVSIW